MKNYRNGQSDVSPALEHPDARLRFTFLCIGPSAAVFAPGPTLDTGVLGQTPTPRNFLSDYANEFMENAR